MAFVIACWTAGRITKNKFISMIMGLVYVLIPYRFYSMKVSGDKKEVLSWVILPLVVGLVFGIYHKIKARCAGKFLPGGLSGVCFFGIALTLLNAPLWLWNIRKIMEGTFSTDGYSLQQRGVYPVQYLMLYSGNGENTGFASEGMVDAAPVGIGFLLTLGVFLYGWILFSGKYKDVRLTKRQPEIRFANMMLGTGLIAAFLSTNVFPWDDLRFSGRLYNLAVLVVWNPSRLVGIAAGCFWAVSCVALLLCLDIRWEAEV